MTMFIQCGLSTYIAINDRHVVTVHRWNNIVHIEHICAHEGIEDMGDVMAPGSPLTGKDGT